MTKLLAAAALILALAGQPALAAFEDQGAGARAPGLGNAFTAVSDDVYAVFYNPAGLAQLERPELGTSYSRLLMGLSDGTNLSVMDLAYAQPLRAGRQGTLAAGLQRFTAGSLYNEQTINLSYGRLIWQTDSGDRLLGGVSVKQLSHGFATPPEAANSYEKGVSGQGTDPILSGKNTQSAMDADLGFLYQTRKRWRLALDLQHLMQPNVAFAGTDKLPMSVRMGAAWRSLWMTLIGEVHQQQSPTGSTDRDFTLAAERYFPTLTMGQFGMRGSLGFGSRDYEQITLGLGYRINKIQLDYAFLMPLGTVEGTAGTHRVAFTWHFGAPAPEDEITQELLDQARQMREGRGPGYGYEYTAELRPLSLDDPRLADVRRLIEIRYYRQAQLTLTKFIVDQRPNAPLVRLSNRLDLVAQYYPDWSGPRSRWDNFVVAAIYEFLHGHDRKAILKASYAFSLNRNDSKFNKFLADLENAVGIQAERLAPDNPRGFANEMLARVEAANSRHEVQTVSMILQDLLELDDQDVATTEKVGSMYYILGRYQEAIATWTMALRMEKTATENTNIQYHINLARQRMGGNTAAPEAATPPALSTAPVTAPAAAPAEAPAEAPAPAKPAASRKSTNPEAVERLFQKGVEHYARGEYLQATAMFMRILQIDPTNAQALKAMERLQNKTPSGGNP